MKSGIVVATYGATSFGFKNEPGLDNMLVRMNLRLAKNSKEQSNLYLLNAQRLIKVAGKNINWSDKAQNIADPTTYE